MTHWEFGLWGSGGLLLIPTSMIYRKQMICDAHKENKSTYRMLLLRTFLVGKEIHKFKKRDNFSGLEVTGGGRRGGKRSSESSLVPAESIAPASLRNPSVTTSSEPHVLKNIT